MFEVPMLILMTLHGNAKLQMLLEDATLLLKSASSWRASDKMGIGWTAWMR